jgi:hypothetical protein
MTKARTTVEKPEGHGVIQFPDRKTVSVRYALVVIRTLDDAADSGAPTGQIEIRGAIEVSPNQERVDLSEKHFTLQLDDGRCLQARTKKAIRMTRHWEIVGTGSKGLEPC